MVLLPGGLDKVRRRRTKLPAKLLGSLGPEPIWATMSRERPEAGSRKPAMAASEEKTRHVLSATRTGWSRLACGTASMLRNIFTASLGRRTRRIHRMAIKRTILSTPKY